jgi:hypothetical protein
MSALYGGAALMISPDGELLGLPLYLLNGTPFTSFFSPAIILFFVLGILPLLSAWGLLKNKKSALAEKLNLFKDMQWSWSFGIYSSFFLVVWLQIQMMFLSAVSWLHAFYMFLAIAILISGLRTAVRNNFQKSV